mgnify:CR=1 FL=1
MICKGVKITMSYTDNPLDDFHRHDAKQQAWLDRLPKCENCGHPIQQEKAVKIKGFFYCDDCLDDDMRVSIEYEC